MIRKITANDSILATTAGVTAVGHTAKAAKVHFLRARQAATGRRRKLEFGHHLSDRVATSTHKLKELRRKPDLTIADTRPQSTHEAVCACGDEDGAKYYAISHNRLANHPCPLVVEFEAPADSILIDGRDFPYTIFQRGYSEARADAIYRALGPAALSYAQQALSLEDQKYRVAFCHLTCQDPDVILYHYGNSLVIAGHYRTIFRSAFFVKCPVSAANVRRVWSPNDNALPTPDIRLDAL